MKTIRINFRSTKRYRNFAFLPRQGDRINISDDGKMFALNVDSVWFDDHYGKDDCETNVNCTVVEEQEI